MNLALAKVEMHIRQDANRAERLRDVSHLKHGSFGRSLELLHGENLRVTGVGQSGF
jgi:hypothetical protein